MDDKKKAFLWVVVLFCFNLTLSAQTISLKMNKVSVKKAMIELQSKSGYSFVYETADLNTKEKDIYKSKEDLNKEKYDFYINRY